MKNPLNKDKPNLQGTQQPNTNSSKVDDGKLTKTPKAKVDTLVKRKTEKEPWYKNPMYIIGMAVAALMLIGLIIAVFAFSGNKETPQSQAIPDAPTPEEIAAAEAEAKEKEGAQEAQMSDSETPLFAISPTPIATLAESSMDGALEQTPEYLNGDGVNLAFPNGSMIPLGHPFVQIAKANAQKRVADYIESNDIIDERVSPETGEKDFYIRLPDGNFAPITETVSAKMVEDGMRAQAAVFLSDELANAPVQSQSVMQEQQALAPVAPPAPVIVDELSQQERAEYKDLIEKTRMVNRQLVEDNKRLKQDMQTQKEAMVKALQRIEDNNFASRKLRASAIPLSSGWEVLSLENNLLWLKAPDGTQVTVAEGETIPTTNMKIITTDAASHMVYISDK